MNLPGNQHQENKDSSASSKIKFFAASTHEIVEIERFKDPESNDDNLEKFHKQCSHILQAENLIVLAGSGTSLTFNESQPNTAPSMWDLWVKCLDAFNNASEKAEKTQETAEAEKTTLAELLNTLAQHQKDLNTENTKTQSETDEPNQNNIDELTKKVNESKTAIDDFYKNLEIIKQTKYDITNHDNHNIETLLSFLEQIQTSYHSMSGLTPEQNKTKKTIKDFLNQSKEIILEETNFTNKINEKDWSTHETLLRLIGYRQAKKQRLKLFTTNYDLAFEQAASRVGLMVIDGFNFNQPQEFNPAWFDYDIVKRNAAVNHEDKTLKNVINLYKMHGSVDWSKSKEDNKLIKVQPNEATEPVFIYPSSNKYQSSYKSPHLEMIAAFMEALKQPNTALLCLGFGFNDDHINNAIEMALKTNPQFHLMIATKAVLDDESSFNKDMKPKLMRAINNGHQSLSLVDSTLADFVEFCPAPQNMSERQDLTNKIWQILEANQ